MHTHGGTYACNSRCLSQEQCGWARLQPPAICKAVHTKNVAITGGKQVVEGLKHGESDAAGTVS